MRLARMALFSLVFLNSIANGEGEPVKAISQKNQLFAPLTVEQKLEDFGVICSWLRNFYGPLSRKAETAGLEFENKVKEIQKTIRENHDGGGTDEDFFDVLSTFLSQFRDTHMSFYRSDEVNVVATLGFYVSRVVEGEGDAMVERAIISHINRTALDEMNHPIYVGDELVSINGRRKPAEIATELEKIINWSAPGAKRDYVFSQLSVRSAVRFNVRNLLNEQEVIVVIRDRDGNNHPLHLRWMMNQKLETPSVRSQILCEYGFCRDAHLSVPARNGNPTARGAREGFLDDTPSFYSSLPDCLNLDPARLSGWKTGADWMDEEENIFKEEFEGKTGICVRKDPLTEEEIFFAVLPLKTFSVNNSFASFRLYRRMADFYQKYTALMIIDQTDNPGGACSLRGDLLSLFAKTTSGCGHSNDSPDPLQLRSNPKI